MRWGCDTVPTHLLPLIMIPKYYSRVVLGENGPSS